MGWQDRVWSWLAGARQDSAPALPGPAPMVQRRDSVYSPLSNFGNPAWDKSVSTRPNPYAMPLTEAELRAAYRTDGLARRIVDLRPSRATRKGWTVPDIGISEDRRLRTWERACIGGQMGGLLGGAIGLMVTEDDVPRSFRTDPRRWREQPLNLDRIGVLHALHIFDATEARPVEWEEDLRETGYWMPRIWQINRGRLSIRVHASRVLHFRGARRLPSETQGAGWYSNGLPDDSFLQAVWDQISALAVTMQAGAQFAHELRQTILQIGDLSAKQVGDESNLLADRLALMRQTQSSMDVTVLGPDDKFEVRATPVTGFKELTEGAQQMLSTVLGWPRSMLSGEPPGGLSTDDESGLERERTIVSDYQETELRQPLEQLYRVLYRSQDGPTGGVEPDEWEVTFTELDSPTAKESAELQKIAAETDAIRISSGVISPEDATRSRHGESGWKLDLDPVKPPDPIEEAEIEAERMRVLREAGALPGAPVEGEEDPEADPEDDEGRGDAIDADSVCILVPAADPGLRAAVERAIGQTLVVEGEPHVTALYLGRGLSEEEIAEVVAVVAEEARLTEPGTLMQGSIRAFLHGPDGTPIVVEFSDTWAIGPLHDRLLRRLAHLIRARQHRTFRPHVTVGYAANALTPEASTALLSVDVSEVRVAVGELRVQVGGQVVATVPVGG